VRLRVCGHVGPVSNSIKATVLSRQEGHISRTHQHSAGHISRTHQHSAGHVEQDTHVEQDARGVDWRTHVEEDTHQVGRTWSGLKKDSFKRSGLSGRGQQRCAGPDVLWTWTWTLVKARQLLLFTIACLMFCLLFSCFCNICC